MFVFVLFCFPKWAQLVLMGECVFPESVRGRVRQVGVPLAPPSLFQALGALAEGTLLFWRLCQWARAQALGWRSARLGVGTPRP